MRHLYLFIILFLMGNLAIANPQNDDEFIFDDSPLKEDLHLPDWFSLSFLDLSDSLSDAQEDGKKGIILYFGRKDCAYCKTLLQLNWGDPAIIKFTKKNFNVIAIDVLGDRTITDFTGKTWSEKDYAAHMQTNFTPSLLFYNNPNKLALRLTGYRSKYQFRAALEYAADQHYLRESFRQYLTRAELALNYGSETLNENDFFIPPPYNLNRNGLIIKKSSNKPLMVLFEHPRCHACDILHGDTLNNPEIATQLHELDVYQLNEFEDTPIITPQGTHSTTKKWANELNLTFAPAIIFFDSNGNEIIRIESVVRFYRLNKILGYILSKAYTKHETFQDWLHSLKTENLNKNP